MTLEQVPGKVRGLQHAGSASGFLVAKVMVLLVPLFLSNQMAVEDYGKLELALAIATVLAIAAGLGLNAAIPYFLLQRSQPEFDLAFHLHEVLLAGLAVGLGMGLYSATGNTTACLIALLLGTLAIQLLRGNRWKAMSSPIWASFTESGVYIVLGSLLVIGMGVGTVPTLPAICVALCIYVVILASPSVKYLRANWRGGAALALYREAIRFGLPLIFVSFATLLLVNSGRLLVGYALPVDRLAMYSFLLRITAPVLIIHQLLATIFFRRIYMAPMEVLDRYFSCLLAVILTVSLAGYFMTPLVLAPHFKLAGQIVGEYRSGYLVLTIQMVYWVAMALLENVITRSNLGRVAAWMLAGLVLVFGVLVLGLHEVHRLDFVSLCRAHMGILLATACGQLVLLKREGLALPRTAFIIGFTLFVYITLAAFGIGK